MMFIEDGRTPVWQDHLDHPPLEYKHLERDRFEELLDLMIAAYPCLLYTSDAADEGLV